MNARRGLIVLSSGALALGLLAPAAVMAAPQAQKPSGEAMVRIDGGTASAIAKGKHTYRVVVPREASISWLGDADRTLAIGTLGRKGLVAAWARLGHSTHGTHAQTTITWTGAGDARATFVGAHLGKPRINADGQLTFLAHTTGPLPQKLREFSLNIARPSRLDKAPMTRSGYPLVFPVNAASSTVGAQATATGDTTADIAFVNLSNGVVTSNCSKPTTKSVSGSADYVTFAGTCGDITWSGGVLSFFPAQSGIPSQLQMSATLLVKGSTSTFNWDFNMAQWSAGGVKVFP